jgi:hypothetical protein
MRSVEAGPFDDHHTDYGHCSDCDRYLVCTEIFGKGEEWREMTAPEQQREIDRYDPTPNCSWCGCDNHPTADNE